ncbi:MAG: NAD(P)-dependent oxidoreductase [Cyanobacteria bacterium J06639_1]
MSAIAILGLGAMGSRMAKNLIAAGHAVTVYNRTPERAQPLVEAGATRADTPRQAVASAEFVISMVTDDDASRAVWTDEKTGAIANVQPGAIAIESSTLTPAWIAELAGMMSDLDTQFLDAPVAGSRPQAEAGQLIYLVGGETETVDRCRSLFDITGGKLHHLGSVGSGTAMKLAINSLFAIQVAAFGEMLAFVEALGISREAAAAVLTDSPVASPVLKGVLGQMVAESFAPLFPIDLVEKDLRYALSTATASRAELPTTQVVRDVFERARQAGYGSDNISGVVQLYSRSPASS